MKAFEKKKGQMNGMAGIVHENGANHQRRNPQPQPYLVWVSIRFLVITFASTMVLAFGLGRIVRMVYVDGNLSSSTTATSLPVVEHHQGAIVPNRSAFVQHSVPPPIQLPPPTLADGKQVPRTIYTSKILDTARTASSDSVLARRPSDDHQTRTDSCEMTSEGVRVCQDDHLQSSEDNEEHLPAGQHVLVDLRNVDGAFLNSKESLAQAMVDLIRRAGLTMLSYHCHSLIPTGVSCVAVLLESHVSFHSWPASGVILLDLFTCGASSLLPLIPVIRDLFAIPKKPAIEGEVVEPPTMRWAHKLRGFRPEREINPLSRDLGLYFLGVLELEMKEEIVSVKTDYQTIDIYDFIEPRFRSLEAYQRSLSNDGSYESQHPELFLPNRAVFLDGVIQSRRIGEAEYHEALVHPAMFSHPHPERVAIIGGGEGATLREVLKHKTVKEAVMIEIDEQMVNVSRTYLPEWNDCRDLIGSKACCFDDPRATLYFEDALAWFIHRFENQNTSSASDRGFDVIIMDALDPEDDIEFSEVLYNNMTFFKALSNALTEDGVLVMQTGEAPTSMDPPESISRFENRATVYRHLADVGFESIHLYEESHCAFLKHWTFLVAFKSFESREFWFRNAAEIALAMHQRSMPTHSGESPFKYFDGTTMMSYRYPARSVETVFCREEPVPKGCAHGHGFNPENPLVPTSSLEVRTSSFGERAGRGVFTKVFIPQGSYVGLEEAVNKVYVPSSTFSVIEDLLEQCDAAKQLEPLYTYMNGYGFQGDFHGGYEVAVDGNILTFVNHGCNGTNNIGQSLSIDEVSVGRSILPELLTTFDYGSTRFNPFLDRNVALYFHEGNAALRDISPGDEVLDNYLTMTVNPEEWKDDVEELRAYCTGQQLGEVSRYEARRRHRVAVEKE